jgi:flagellar assembly protein FliH
MAQSESAAEQRIAQAREEGLREGEALGRARAEEHVRAAVDRLAAAIAKIEDYRTSLYRQVETDAVRLAFAIARRVLRRELTVDPSAIEGLANAALERLQSQESCRVRMHPDHVPALRAAIERLGMTSKVEVIPDAAQEAGAAVFELTRGNLDASVDAQLREIERGLADRFER